MNVNDAFPSKYLAAADLRGTKIAVKIARIEMAKVGQDTKPVLYFAGKEKGLVLNKTNSMMIAAGYGPETDAWISKTIHLYPAKVQFQNQMVDSIRVETPAPEATPGAEPVF